MKISVIMPTYNRAFCISESINSVLSQNIDSSVSLELIIVDDCSTDNTFAIVEPYLSKNVIYHKNIENKGGAESRNIGVSLSTGDYLSFIDSDVVWYDNKLSSQISNISDQNEVVYCKYRKQDGDNWIVMPNNSKNGKVNKELLFDNFVDTPSVLLSRKIFDKSGGFDSKLPRFQDWDLFINISKFSKFKLVDLVLYDSKTLSKSITSDDNARIISILRIYSKYYNQIKNDKRLNNRFIYKIIFAYIILNRKKDALNFLRKVNTLNNNNFSLNIILIILKIFPFSLLNKIIELIK